MNIEITQAGKEKPYTHLITFLEAQCITLTMLEHIRPNMLFSTTRKKYTTFFRAPLSTVSST